LTVYTNIQLTAVTIYYGYHLNHFSTI